MKMRYIFICFQGLQKIFAFYMFPCFHVTNAQGLLFFYTMNIQNIQNIWILQIDMAIQWVNGSEI